jgi:predicted nucleotidyltransferase
MFSVEERDAIRARLIERARRDARISGVAVTGSFAVGASDAWSDIDLALSVADDADRVVLMHEFSAWMERELGTLHHWDLPFQSSIYRVYLLPRLLEVDLAFTPAADFAPRGPRFRSVFGPTAPPVPSPAPDLDSLVGHAWHHALHAAAAIERGRPWQAEHMLSGLRDQVLALRCVQCGKPSAHARGADELEPAITQPLERSLVASLDPSELRRALHVAIGAFRGALSEVDAALASRLAPPLEELLERTRSVRV